MTFDVKGKTLTMTAYQVDGLGSYDLNLLQNTPPTQLPPGNLTLTPIETVVLNHFTNVSSQVGVKTSQMTFDPAKKLYRCNLELTNNGSALKGNIQVVLDGLLNLRGVGTPDNEYDPQANDETGTSLSVSSIIAQNTGLITNVMLENQTGSNNGEPMIKAKHAGLNKGESVVVPLWFSNPSNAAITFNPIVYQE